MDRVDDHAAPAQDPERLPDNLLAPHLKDIERHRLPPVPVDGFNVAWLRRLGHGEERLPVDGQLAVLILVPGRIFHLQGRLRAKCLAVHPDRLDTVFHIDLGVILHILILFNLQQNAPLSP